MGLFWQYYWMSTQSNSGLHIPQWVFMKMGGGGGIETLPTLHFTLCISRGCIPMTEIAYTIHGTSIAAMFNSWCGVCQKFVSGRIEQNCWSYKLTQAALNILKKFTTSILVLNSLESYSWILLVYGYHSWFNWYKYNWKTSSKTRGDKNRFSTQPLWYSGNVQEGFLTKKVEVTARSMSCSRRKFSSG